MDEPIRHALSRGHNVAVTTTGRRSGLPRRIELVFHNIDGRIYLSGLPGFPRDWLANMRADPNITFHLEGRVAADLPATARELTEPHERRAVMERVALNWRRTDVDVMMTGSPLVEILFERTAAPIS